MGPRNIAVLIITKNFPPSIASWARREREACFFRSQALMLALVLVPAQRDIASHDSGMVKATLIRVALIIPNILVVAMRDPSTRMSPSAPKITPKIQYNFLFFMKVFLP